MKMSLSNLFAKKGKKNDYDNVKRGFEAICRLERKLTKKIPDRNPGFDLCWLNKNIESVRKLFIQKPGLHIYYYSDKANIVDKCCILDDILIKEERIMLNSRGHMLNFYNPSSVNFEISKGIGNSYAMHVYSKANIPSKLSLIFYNI